MSPISVKYGGYDQPVINCPPWAKELLDKGYSVVLDMLVFDAEHPHPLYWYSNDIIYEIFSNIRNERFSGVAYQDFMIKGRDSQENPIRVLTQKTVGKAMKQERFTDAEATTFLQKYYGKGADDILKSLKAVSVSQENFIKLMPAWFWQGDGLTPGGLQSYRFWMLKDNPEAIEGMDFIRRDAVSVDEYVATKVQGDAIFNKAEKKWADEGRLTPLQIIYLMQKNADSAVESALSAQKLSSPKAPYLRDIVASSFIHKELVLRQIAFLRAAIAFYESGYVFDDKYNKSTDRVNTSINSTTECIKQMEIVAYHDKVMAELCRKYAPRRPERRGKNDFSFEKKVAAAMNLKLNIPDLDEVYLNEIEKKIK